MSYEFEGKIPIFNLLPQKEDRWRQHLIDLSVPVPPPEPVLLQTSSGIPLLYKRGIHIISGKQKSGKTFLNSMLMSSLLNNEDKFGFVAAREDIKVLFVDTEQDISDTFYVTQRIHALNKWDELHNNPLLLSVNLREQQPAERKEIVEEALKANHPDVLFLDGVVDLSTDFNDLSEGQAIVSMLMKWASAYDVAIVTVLHENKGDQNLRGHLGTLLGQKGECNLQVTIKDDGQPFMECKVAFSRHQPIDEFSFRIEQGMPVVYEPLGAPKSGGINYDNIFKEALGSARMKNQDLSLSVSRIAKISISSARRYISIAKSTNVIKMDNGYYVYKGNLPFKNEDLPF